VSRIVVIDPETGYHVEVDAEGGYARLPWDSERGARGLRWDAVREAWVEQATGIVYAEATP
jgi:hypothetical protein